MFDLPRKDLGLFYQERKILYCFPYGGINIYSFNNCYVFQSLLGDDNIIEKVFEDKIKCLNFCINYIKNGSFYKVKTGNIIDEVLKLEEYKNKDMSELEDFTR